MPYDDRQLDDLLDRGLREYSQAEPRPGLEDRILANLRARPEPRPWWRTWMPALAAAAAIIVMVALALRPHDDKPGPRATARATVATAVPPVRQTSPSVTSEKQVPVIAPRRVARAPRVVAAKTTPTVLPRQQTFPAPTPLTDQEKLVLALLRHAPDEAIQVAQSQEAQRARTDSFLRTGEFPDAPGPDTRNPQ